MAPRRNGDPLKIVRGLYVYWGILGLCPFVPVEGAKILRSSYVGVVYATIITLVYLVIYFQAIANRMNFNLSRDTSMYMISDISGASVEFLVVVTAWLGFALRRNELARILKGLKNIHVIFKDIDVDQDFGTIVKTAKFHTFFVNIIWFVFFCCDHALLAGNERYEIAIWIPFNFPRVITHNVMIMFIDGLLIVNKLFRLLNEKIYDLSNEVTSRPRLIVTRNRRGSNNCRFESVVRLGPLDAYGQIHSELVTLTKMIVDFFSLSITLTLIVNYIQMASDFYIVCVLARDSMFANWRERGTLATRFCWGCVHLTETVIMMAISDSTANEEKLCEQGPIRGIPDWCECRTPQELPFHTIATQVTIVPSKYFIQQANRAGSVLHEMLTSVHTENFLASAQILSFRLLRRPLKIEVYGLFEMRLSVVHGIIGMVGTYVTVAMQLDAQGIMLKKINSSFSQPMGSELGPWNGTSTTESK